MAQSRKMKPSQDECIQFGKLPFPQTDKAAISIPDPLIHNSIVLVYNVICIESCYFSTLS